MTSELDLVGATLDRLPTPALVVDLDALQRNLELLAALLSGFPIGFRPHAKAHKCIEIAKRQMELGATGICCQTVAEVEAFAAGGIGDILLTNQIVDPRKIARLAAVPENVRVGICVDSLQGLELVAAANRGRPFDIYVEVDVGGGRCGVADPAAAVALARAVRDSGLSFSGLQAYNGRIQHLRNAAEREQAVSKAAAATSVFVEALETAGLAPPVISGGGTGTFDFDRLGGTLNEVQCGSYALMDADYLAVRRPAGARFEAALTILASVISSRATHAVVDAGLKAAAVDSGLPVPRDHPQIAYGNPSDEHGVLRSALGEPLPPTASRVHLIAGHCDPTVALHQRIYAARAGVVEEVWPIVAQGIW